MLEHGGHLRAAAVQYNIPLQNWLDLSTGINPNGWPVPAIPAECWQRLPEDDDGLLEAAQNYYGNQSILPVAGSQAAIQTLPLLRSAGKVGVLHPAYAEHADNWHKAGHTVIELQPEEIDNSLPELDVLILINPNNPTGQTFDREQLLSWHHTLRQKNGWLIIDEAFADCNLNNSLSAHPVQDSLIILRSLGKFFGLAGVRCGFVIGTEQLLNMLQEKLGPWSISHPSRYITTQALNDIHWQQQTRAKLAPQSLRLQQLLSEHDLPPTGGCELFHWIKTDQALTLHQQLAQQGILTRLFTQPYSLRFGLPKDQSQWLYLEEVLQKIVELSEQTHASNTP